MPKIARSRRVLRLAAAAEVGVLGPVDAAVAPRVAAQQPPAGEDAALDEAVRAERVDRVLRAARVVLARARPASGRPNV